MWFDTVTLSHLGRTDPRHLTGSDRLDNGRSWRSQLIGISVASGDNNTAAAALFLGHCRSEKIISLITRGFGIGEATGCDELGEDLQLLDELVVEFTPALIGGKRFMSISGLCKRVPTDQHG